MLVLGRHMIAIVLIGFLITLTNTVAADDLAAQVLAAKDAYRPLDQTDMAAARADVDAAVAALEARFAIAGESAEGWRIYVGWDRLQEELAKPDGPDLAQLKETADRLSAGHEGLGLVCFSDLGDAIGRYLNVAGGVGDANAKASFETVLDRLAASLESHAKAPNGQDANMISAYLRWLSDARQTPELVETIRLAMLDRNFYGNLSVGLLSAAMGRDVDETAPVRDNILGTRIHGTGRTTGSVAVEFVPSEDHATIVTKMTGTNASTTVGYNGPVVIHSDGTTELTTRKQILIDGERLWTGPAQADATTRSHIRSIRARNGMRLIECIAWKRAYRQKCQAEAIAAQHAEQQARERFDDEVNALIASANDDVQKKIRGPLIERGLYPTELRYSTDESSLNLAILQAGAFDLGAKTEPPSVAADADLRMQVHESMVNNFAAGALAGTLLREERVQEAVKNLLGKLPEELESEEGAESWGIAFQSNRPVWVAFEDNQFTLTIRGRGFYEGDTPHPPMDITVVYQLVGEGENVKAVRQGEVEIFPPGFDPEGDKQLTAQQTAIRSILQRRLGKQFGEEIVPEDLVLPNEWSRAGTLKLIQWEIKNGWLVLSWKRTGNPAPAKAAAVAGSVGDSPLVELQPLDLIQKVSLRN